MEFETYSSGKILLTSEYFVLEGALSLAIPTKYGQSFTFKKNSSGFLSWKSYNSVNKIWFECKLKKIDFKCITTTDSQKSNILISILKSAKKLNNLFFCDISGGDVITKLDFPNNWGLGSSSTLINNIAKWTKVNPYDLLWSVFNGSGYDIACANSKSAILYKVKQKKVTIEKIQFKPSFHQNIFFIHLNKKQNTNDSLKTFGKKNYSKSVIDVLSKLTKNFVNVKSLKEFQKCIKTHESIISKSLEMDPVKEKFFKDYNGEIKSLGAWGGDFILAAGPNSSIEYFQNKGFKTIISYNEMFNI